MLDYYYEEEGEQFAFYRVPKVLFQNEAFKGLSMDAKILYGILLDRVTLSQQNGWKDDRNRIYIIFTIEEVMDCLQCGNKKAVQLLEELERKGGLIEKRRQGLGKPNIIYVKNFIRPVDKSDDGHFKKCQNHTSESVKATVQEMSKTQSNNTDNNKTDKNDTENSIYPDKVRLETQRQYEAWFTKALEPEVLKEEYPGKADMIDGIFELLVEICGSNKAMTRVSGSDLPTEVVKSRLMKLNSSHIRYVIDIMRHNASDIRNIRQYLLTALYNAPTTMSVYYQTKVNHDVFNNKGGTVNAEESIGYSDY